MSIAVELFRFRIVRNYQAQKVDPRHTLDLSHLDAVPQSPASFLSGDRETTVIDPDTFEHWLTDLSTQLALRADSVLPSAVVKLLPNNWMDQVAADAWGALQHALAASLAAAFAAALTSNPTTQSAASEGLARLLRLHSLVTMLHGDAALPEEERSLKSVHDVNLVAGHTTVILPAAYFKLCPYTPKLVRQPGFTDFYIVKDEWNRYEAGELARVINVLPGETFDTRIRHLESTQTTVSTTTDTKTSEQTENSQTLSTSLSQSSTKDANLNIGVQGQVQTSGQYGPVHVDASVGAQVQASLSDSETKAFTTTTENLQRSVKEVSTSVIEAQTKRTRVTDSTSEHHQLANNDATVTVGLYRWLTEVHRAQLWRYPNRLVLEFEIPEPGAWFLWALKNAPSTFFNQDPGPFRLAGATHDLSPLDLDANTIAQLATQWLIQGLQTPPPASLTLSVKVTTDPSQNQDPGIASDASMIIPDGYVAKSWHAEVFSAAAPTPAAPSGEIGVTVGGSGFSQATKSASGIISGGLSGDVGPVNTGSVPVTVYSLSAKGFTCIVNVNCDLMPETLRHWQQATFDLVAQAYQNLREAHHQEEAAAAQQPGSLAGLIGPPDLNRARATAELKRLVIEELMGSRFDGEPAISVDAASGEPNVDINKAAVVAPTVQFFEQAFEWENLVYICYPYYWARRQQWPTNALATTSDPEFDRFLNSGSARVVVPARPGFENLVNFFRYTGCVWGGRQPPAPQDPAYLSVAQEIQALETGATDGTPVGSSWELSLPTTLLWAGDDPATLPTNENASIPAPSP